MSVRTQNGHRQTQCPSVPKLGTDGHPVTKVTTGHKKIPKMGQNSIIRPFFARRAKKALGRSPPQELEVGPRSGPYLLVLNNGILKSNSSVFPRSEWYITQLTP